MNTPMIVVTEEKNRRKGLLWMAGITAGAVALVGGGTFALWSASDDFSGGSITAGDLNITVTAESGMFDVSEDRADRNTNVPGTGNLVNDEWANGLMGHKIDTANWRIVPGDTVAMAIVADVVLVGDNMVAALTLTELDDEGDGLSDALNNPFMEWSYEVYVGGALRASGDIDDFSEELHLAYLTTNVLNSGVYFDDTVPNIVFNTDASGESVVTVVVTGRFMQGTAGANNHDAGGAKLREAVNSVAGVTGATLHLNQVRHTGAGF
ncbi:MAG: SipW-dependent-type signal peptide-containing protein [Promicromonosporaceae bacterium]|nr:SipW-dependent-type signal peptide-containing protein [Promicromonosporaceae bacterium]